MRVVEIKSSKCRKESRRNSAGGIHPSSPAHLHTACLLFRWSGKRDAELKRIFFSSVFSSVLWKNKFSRGNPAL